MVRSSWILQHEQKGIGECDCSMGSTWLQEKSGVQDGQEVSSADSCISARPSGRPGTVGTVALGVR